MCQLRLDFFDKGAMFQEGIMPKKMLAFAVAAVVALVIGLTAIFLLKNKEPTEAEIRSAIASALPKDATIDQMTFAVFPADRASGRVSVKGTYSFNHDLFSLPTPPLALMKSLSQAQIYDRDLSDWWAQNSGYYPQFKGKLGEFQKVYANGASLEFSGEFPYIAVVDGTKVDGTGLVYKPLDGTIDPKFGYLSDDVAKIKELTAAIIEWRDRQIDEAKAAAAVAAKAAADEAAKQATDAAARAAAEAAATAAAGLAAEKANARTEAVDVRNDCGGKYAALRNCRNVYFGINEKYRVESKEGVCPVADPGHDVTWEKLATNQYDVIPNHDGARVTLYELSLGESFGGYTCK